MRSLIYWDIRLYRSIMTLLYSGKYAARFEAVEAFLGPDDRSVLELCFGDTRIAEFCRRTGRSWVGLDLNKRFVDHACGKGYDARAVDLLNSAQLPAADVCIMMGSLYHFESVIDEVVEKMLGVGKKLILSEPVVNLSARPGIIGALARRMANAGHGSETFRFGRKELVDTMSRAADRLGFSTRVSMEGRDLIMVLEREGTE